MSNYTKTTDFAAKDDLTTGNANKVVSGTELDDEFNNISTAIATKVDTTDTASESAAGIVELATTAEAAAGTDTARAVTAAGVEAWGAQNAGMVQDISNLADPAADTVLGWDDSAGAVIGFTAGAGIVFSGTTITADHDAATNFVANEHIDHSTVSVVAGNGLTGGGTIAADRTLNVVGGDGITANANDVAVDSTVIRTTGTQTIGGLKTFTTQPIFSGAGGFLYLASSANEGGDVTISTAAPSGTPADGDLWLQREA